MPYQHAAHFKDFLRDEVNLNQSRINNLMEKRDSIDKFLSDQLPGYEKTEQQGSWALKTIIKPVRDGQEYDADLLLFLAYDSSWQATDYIDTVYQAFRSSGTYRNKVSKGTRCVTLAYAGDFHLDIVPCVQIPYEVHELHVCNSVTNGFEPSDGNGYREWFNGKNALTEGNLKRTVKLLKYLRDHRSNFTCRSILLTTLCGLQIDQFNNSQAKSVADALLLVTSGIKVFLQSHPLVPTILNPALPTENFNRHWNQQKYDHFKTSFIRIADDVHAAYHEEDKSKSLQIWRKLFTDKFAASAELSSAIYAASPLHNVAHNPPKPWCDV